MNEIIGLLARILIVVLFVGLWYLNRLIITKLHPKSMIGFLGILIISLLVNVVLLGVLLFFGLSGGGDGGPIIAAFGTFIIGIPLALYVAVSSLSHAKNQGSKSPTPRNEDHIR